MEYTTSVLQNFQKLICKDEKIVENIMAYSTKQGGAFLVLDDMITSSDAVKKKARTEPNYHKSTLFNSFPGKFSSTNSRGMKDNRAFFPKCVLFRSTRSHHSRRALI